MDFLNKVNDQTIVFMRKGIYGFRVHNESFWRIPSIAEYEISNFNTIAPTPINTFKKTHLITFEQTPINSYEITSIQTLEQTPMMSSEQTPLMSLELTPMRSSELTPNQTHSKNPTKSLEKPLIQSQFQTFEQALTNSNIRTPIYIHKFAKEKTKEITIIQTSVYSNDQTIINSQTSICEQTPFNSLDYSTINTINETYTITFTELSTHTQITLNLLEVTLMIVFFLMIVLVIFHFLNPKVDSSEQSFSYANEMWD